MAGVQQNNRLASASYPDPSPMPGGPISVSYSYDDCGQCVSEGVERKYEWDHAGRLRSFRNQATDATEPTQYVHYLYDASGQRVKKLNRKQLGNDWDVVVYIDGVLEQRTQKRGATTKQGVVLHVLDGGKRLGMRRSDETFDAKPENILVLSDHLGSGSVELDWSLGDFIDREEFRPYGETSFGSYAHKRYRFTGKERDEESGLNYHGARYYAPGLARWMSPDPKGLVAGVNLYGYVRGNPVRLSDPTGTEAETNAPAAKQIPQSITPQSDSMKQRGLANFDTLTRGPISERNAPNHIVLPSEVITGMELAWQGSFARERGEAGRIKITERRGELSCKQDDSGGGYHFIRTDDLFNRVDLVSKDGLHSDSVPDRKSKLEAHTHPSSPENPTAPGGGDLRRLVNHSPTDATTPSSIRMSLVRAGSGTYILALRTRESDRLGMIGDSVYRLYENVFDRQYHKELKENPINDKNGFFNGVPLMANSDMTTVSGGDSSGVITHHNARSIASFVALKEVARVFHLVVYQGDAISGLHRVK